MDHLSSFEDIIATDITVLSVAMVFIASLVGSLHCVGMCGGLAGSTNKDTKSVVGYHLGRLVGYLSVGLIVAFFGQKIFQTVIKHKGFFAALSVAVVIVLLGYLFNKTNWLAHVSSRLFKIIFQFKSRLKLPDWIGGLSLGLVTPFLPCGWLYGFIFLVFTVQDVYLGSVLLGAFWMGTVPSLLAVQLGLKFGAFKLGEWPKRMIVVGMILFGFFNIYQRSHMILNQPAVGEEIHPGESCH